MVSSLSRVVRTPLVSDKRTDSLTQEIPKIQFVFLVDKVSTEYNESFPNVFFQSQACVEVAQTNNINSM